MLAHPEMQEKEYQEGMDLESRGLVDSLFNSAGMQVLMTETGPQL